MSATKRRRLLRRSLGGFLLLILLWAGLVGWQAWQFKRQAQALQQRSATSGIADGAALCAMAAELGSSGRHLRTLLLPAAPVLRHLGWVPRIGPALAALPALSDAGAHLDSAATSVCQTLEPSWPELSARAPAGAGAMLSALNLRDWPWPVLEQELTAAQQAWHTIPATTWSQWPFASQPQLAQVDALLADAVSAVRLGPVGGAVLALQTDQPLHLLVALQNPTELRPSGGFIGSVGSIQLEQGALTPTAFQNSAVLGAVASSTSAMPRAYQRYLRASIWTFRDANWWPDWPQSARVLESFWELNEQPPIDGVLGIDSFVFADLVAIFGPLELPGYGSIDSLQGLYQHYEGPQAGDKVLLGEVFSLLIERIKHSSGRQGLALAASLARNFDQRHLQLALHDGAASAALAERGWDGAIRPAANSQHVQVVDADLSYSDVQTFIDEQITVVQQLNAATAPLTTSVIITYTNRYDPWNASLTEQQIYGFCLDSASGQQQRIPGCYGDYVRIYGPPALELLQIEGADASGEIERGPERASIGAYLVLMPGETRTLRVSYRQPVAPSAPYNFSAFKQAGTDARPFSLVLIGAQGTSSRRTMLRTDQHWQVDATGAVEFASSPPDLAAFERQPNFWKGWHAWQAGDTTGALDQWQRSATADLAVGQAWSLHWRQNSAGALALLNTLQPQLAGSTAQRAQFLRAQILEHAQPEAALATYRDLLSQDADLNQVRIALILALVDQGQAAEAQALLTERPAALIQLQRRAQDLLRRQQPEAADTLFKLLLDLNPHDSLAAEARYQLRRNQAQPPDWPGIVALADSVLPNTASPAQWLERRAEAFTQLQQPAAAQADLEQVVALTPTNALAWYNLGLLRRSADMPGAISAFEAARNNNYSDALSVAIILGDLYAQAGQIDAARAAYQQALALDPSRSDIQAALDALAAP